MFSLCYMVFNRTAFQVAFKSFKKFARFLLILQVKLTIYNNYLSIRIIYCYFFNGFVRVFTYFLFYLFNYSFFLKESSRAEGYPDSNFNLQQICSSLALQVCKFAASSSWQVCKFITRLQQINASAQVTIPQTCSKLVVQVVLLLYQTCCKFDAN